MTPYRFATQRQPRPFTVTALARAVGIDPAHTSRLALRLRIDRRNIMRYRAWGLTVQQADEWAAKVGLHPAEIWPLWDELDRLRGAALTNAAKEACGHGHPLDRTDSAGDRRCSTCPAANARRYRITKKAQVTAPMTLEQAS